MRAICGMLTALAVLCSGCALCPPGYLDDYATVGGKWERMNPTSGRVGSILSDPNLGAGGYASVVQESAPETIDVRGEPMPVPEEAGESILQDGDLDSQTLDLSPPSYETQLDPSAVGGLPVSEGEIILGDRW